MRRTKPSLVTLGSAVALLVACGGPASDPAEEAAVTAELREILTDRSFTGRIEETLERRLGRPVDPALAEVGRLLFFDPILSLTGDNSCSGCHGPNVAFNDSQPIAIGVGNNRVVGPDRRGPYNQRRAPTLLNAAFFPRLMWDSRFVSNSHDPFDNRQGFHFPEPEGDGLSDLDHLLVAQAYTPVVNRVEMAGGFDGDNDGMRAEIARRVDGIEEYRGRFAAVYPEIAGGGAIRYEHIAEALAEFQFTLVRADAPIDAFARGDDGAMSLDEKKGAVSFFALDGCAECHIVRFFANEMFSDFEPHVVGVPQVHPVATNMVFDGPGRDEDYGLAQQTGKGTDRYKFRTSPLRNVVFQPSYMHNGAYLCLEDAVRHHLQVFEYNERYRPDALPSGLQGPIGPDGAVLNNLHRLIAKPNPLTEEEVQHVLAFLRVSLTDPGAAPDSLMHLVPASVPSGLPVHEFERGVPLGGGC